MKKKRRGSKKRASRAHCPFWMFILFVTGWFAVALCAVAIFYASLRAPAERARLAAVKSSAAAPVRASDGNDVGAQASAQSSSPAPAVSIVSCRPLEEGDAETSRILEWLGEENALRRLGDRCMLNDGRTFVTFTYNARVPGSERLYLQHAAGMIGNGGISVNSFYCRTSPRGEPADLALNEGKLELRCTYEEGGEEVSRYIPLDGDGANDARNLIGIRAGTGDFARDYCVERSDGDLCLLRNGEWILASADDDGGLVFLNLKNGADEGKAIPEGATFTIIGTEGGYAYVYETLSDRGHGSVHRIYRVNVRTGDRELIFDR
jgi:hypothetical protein